MRRRLLFLIVLGLVLLVAGCTLTESQIDEIAMRTGEVTETVVKTIAPVAGLSAEAAGGIAGAIGLLASTITGFVLRATARKEVKSLAETVTKK